ncbi:MAG: AAA family ATPase [Sterolibacterium sp.]|nr:AAA family ATPase [Sterolibacterium sp.]
MYLEHYGLAEAPFRITPNTGFFFAGANRGATLDALIYAITHDEGIVKISGEVGSGKTMLCRVLMERLPPHVLTVYLATPSLSREEILYAIADELGIETPTGRANAILRVLQEHLIGLYGKGHQIVVLIDEAHAMPVETLEEIRLLSNLESNHHMLLQLVLFGQPELNEVLARSNMRQLKERITHNFALEPMVRDDIDGYIDFRMRAAGYHGPKLFSVNAVKLIAGASLGLTRRINILADKSLLAAFAENTHQITPRHIHAAIRDAEFGDFRPSRNRLWLGLAAAIVLVVLGASAFFYKKDESVLPPPQATAHVETPALAGSAVSAMPGNFAPATASTPATTPVAVGQPGVRGPSAAAGQAKRPAAKPEPITATTATGRLGEQTRARFEATQLWLKTAPNERWFIQLLGSDIGQASAIENFVLRASEQLGVEQLRVYRVDFRGVQRVGVIYGEYPSREAALRAIQQLPATIRGLSPFPRMVKHLR